MNELLRGWMGERALKWGLRLLGILLTIGPLVIALGMHNWDIKAAVLPSDAEIAEIQGSATGIFGGTPIEDFTFSNYTYDINTGVITADVSFKSNINLSLTITNLSGYATCAEHGVRLGSISMQEQSVVVPENGHAGFTITGTVTPEGVLHIATSHAGDLPTIGLENASITIELYGVSIQIQISVAQGGS